MHYLILLLFFIFFNISFLFAQVEIEMKNGEKYSGIIESEDSSKVNFKIIHNCNDTSFNKKSIKKIRRLSTIIKINEYQELIGDLIDIDSNKMVLINDNGRKIDILRKEIISMEIEEYYKINGYSKFGISFLNPGGMNIIFGYQFRQVGLRIEAGFAPWTNNETWGLQGNLQINLAKSRAFESNFSIAVGKSKVTTSSYNIYEQVLTNVNWTYIAGCIDVTAYGLFIELGLSFGEGDFINPQLLFQFGYILRIIN